MSKSNFLVLVPVKPSLSPELQAKAWALVQRLPAANPEVEFTIVMDSVTERGRGTDRRPWSKVARIRNRILGEHNLSAFSHVMWIDADVVDYPEDIPSVLLAANPTGVSAPMVLIEGTDAFYDTAAFVTRQATGKGKPGAGTLCKLDASPPYWPQAPEDDVVDLCGVGTLYLIHTDIYLAGARHVDHPHYTDHWSVCRAALRMGRRVTVDRRYTAWHAFLPNYGEAWH